MSRARLLATLLVCCPGCAPLRLPSTAYGLELGARLPALRRARGAERGAARPHHRSA